MRLDEVYYASASKMTLNAHWQKVFSCWMAAFVFRLLCDTSNGEGEFQVHV